MKYDLKTIIKDLLDYAKSAKQSLKIHINFSF